MFYRMGCPRCGHRIEYTDIQVGHLAFCKRCNQEMVLRGNPIRVSLGLILVAGAALGYWGLMKYWQWADKNQGRFSTCITKPVHNVYDV